MSDQSQIEWTDATWNPITGCTLVSEGCRHCYAASLAATRLRSHPSRAGLARVNAAGEAKFTGEVRFNEGWLDQPLRWRRPRRIFVCAHGDLFHEAVPDGWVMRVLQIMALAPQHVFQVLTKRPERMRDFFARWHDLSGEDFADFKNARGPSEVRQAHPSGRGQLFAAMLDAMGDPPPGAAYPTFDWMNGMMRWGPFALNHVWIGTSVEDQAAADERIPHLLATPAKVRFVSAEPLLGPVDLTQVPNDLGMAEAQSWLNALGGYAWDAAPPDYVDTCSIGTRLHWVIVGGESGPAARPMHPDWARSLRDQCAAAGVAFFHKQNGAWEVVYDRDNDDPDWRRCDVVARGTPDGRWLNLAGGHGFHGDRVLRVIPVGKKAAGRQLDGREWSEMPG